MLNTAILERTSAPARAPIPFAVLMAEFVIFAVDHGDDPGRVKAFQSWADALSVPYKRLVGSYKGQRETSFIVPVAEWRTIANWIDDQESVLLVSPKITRATNHRKASLYYLADQREEELGVMREVSEEEALAGDAFTYDPASNVYLVAGH